MTPTDQLRLDTLIAERLALRTAIRRGTTDDPQIAQAEYILLSAEIIALRNRSIYGEPTEGEH